MSYSQIFLIVFSGLGVVHGLFLAVFLWTYLKGNRISNKILSILLVVLSFRIGKSVLLEFNKEIDIQLIFIGLGTLLAIGPLFYLYTLSYVDKGFQFKTKYLFHFIPASIGICIGFLVDQALVKSLPTLLFILMFIVYYVHYLAYAIYSFLLVSRAKKDGLNIEAYKLISLLFYALMSVWVVYVLNLFDDFIPYIVGPVLYTIVAYVVSFMVIKRRYIQTINKEKYKTTPVSDAQIGDLFNKIQRLVVDEKQFKKEDITLKSLSEHLNVSPQVLSMVINKKSKMNFNAFINQYRIEEAIRMLQDEQFENHTISSIAFESGFNSITSFNTAFKKQTGKTPLSFRKSIVR